PPTPRKPSARSRSGSSRKRSSAESIPMTPVKNPMKPDASKADMTPLAKTFPGLAAENNPSAKDLREMARGEEITTQFGSPAYVTKLVSSRSAGATFTLEEKTPIGRFQRKA